MSGAKSQAKEDYRKGVEILEALSATNPAHAGIREMLAQAYEKTQNTNN